MTSVIPATPPSYSPLIRALAGFAFILLATGLLALFAPDILPFSMPQGLDIALVVIGAIAEFVSAVLVIRAQRQHGRERLNSVLQQARTKHQSQDAS